MKKIILLYLAALILPTISHAKKAHLEEGQKIKTMGVVVFEFGDVDGVSLETLKIIEVLEKKLGMNVKIFTGHLYNPENFKKGMVFVDPRATFSNPSSVAARIQDWAFKNKRENITTADEEEMKKMIKSSSTELEESITNWIEREKIDFLMPQNSRAIPVQLPLGVAIGRVIERLQIPSISHHHDFRWERDFYMNTNYKTVLNYMETYFPGEFSTDAALTINSHNRDLVYNQRGLKTVLTPNVMNFEDKKFAKLDDYNRDMLSELGIPEEARILGQVTRVVPRKNIEASIDLLSEITKYRNDKKTVLVITGEDGIGDGTKYSDKLKAKISKLGLMEQVFWVSKRVKDHRGETTEGKRIYSLSDLYAYLNKQGMMTYPSTYEGWGNAYAEAVAAKVAVVINRYSVYNEDIRIHGFENIEYTDGKMTKEVALKVNKKLSGVISRDSKVIAEIERNFERGKKYISFETLADKLIEAMEDMQTRYKKHLDIQLKPPGKLLEYKTSRTKGGKNLCRALFN